MRILIIHRELPFPADNGGRLRAAHVARFLASRHQVALACFNSRTDIDDFSERASFVSFHSVPLPRRAPLLRRVFSGLPSEVVDLQCAEMSQAIANSVQLHAPDVLLISDPALAPYLKLYPDKRHVLDYLMVQPLSLQRLAAIARGLDRLMWQLRWLRSVAYHRRIAPMFDLCLVNSEEDQEDLRTNSPGWQRLEFLPNGLDLDQYPLKLAQPEPGTLIYPGSVAYLPNRDAVEFMIARILPLVRKEVPSVRLIVSGAIPDDGTAPMGPGVSYTGRVPDVRPVIAGAWACVVPLRSGAGGTRYKVLESMALGTPVVSTSIGAEGVDWTNGTNILVQDTPEEFAESAIRVLKDVETRNRLSTLGRRLIEERYDWNVLGNRLDDMLFELVGCNASSN